MPDLSPEQLSEARNALGCGVPFELIAKQFGVSVPDLRRMLGMPTQTAERKPRLPWG